MTHCEISKEELISTGVWAHPLAQRGYLIAIDFTAGKLRCGLHRWLSGKESAYQAGDSGSIPESGRSPGGRNGKPFQYFAWRVPGTESGGRGQRSPRGHKELNTTEHACPQFYPLSLPDKCRFHSR